MKLTVFGATGGVGRHVVTAALDRGDQVVAYVRNPAKLDTHPKPSSPANRPRRRPACRQGHRRGPLQA